MIELEFSIFAPSLKEQAEKQGIAIKNVDMHQEHAKYISVLRIHSIITSAEADRAFKRLVKKIADDAEKAMEQND